MSSTRGAPSRVSMIGNQPLGEQRGMGLNEVRASALADRIAQAVAEAAAAGNMSRKDVFAKFADQPKTVVYRHIAKAIEATGAKLEKTKLPRRTPAMTEAEQEAELTEAMPAVEEIEQLASGQVMMREEPAARVVEQGRPEGVRDLVVNAAGEVTIDLSAGMERALARAEKLMLKAEHEDGEVRNARLMVVAIDLYGKTAERKARMDADLSDASQQKVYLRQIGQAIMQEEPETRRRILGRLRGINPTWGLL